MSGDNMTIKSQFAILDVKGGRAVLARRVKQGEKIPVVIRGFIDCQWSDNDGTSIEFAIDVVSAKELKGLRRE